MKINNKMYNLPGKTIARSAIRRAASTVAVLISRDAAREI